jgi:hypothetical protein
MCYSEYTFDEYTFIIMAPGTGSGAALPRRKRQQLAGFSGSFIF